MKADMTQQSMMTELENMFLEITYNILTREQSQRMYGRQFLDDSNFRNNMEQSQNDIRMTLFGLENLFKSQENMHIKIDGRFKRVTSFDIFPQAKFHAKIEITQNAVSPVVLLLHFNRDQPINDLYVYGSFKVKKPGIDTQLDLSAKNNGRLVISEPTGRLSFTMPRTMYLTFESLQTAATLNIRCLMKTPGVKDETATNSKE